MPENLPFIFGAANGVYCVLERFIVNQTVLVHTITESDKKNSEYRLREGIPSSKESSRTIILALTQDKGFSKLVDAALESLQTGTNVKVDVTSVFAADFQGMTIMAAPPPGGDHLKGLSQLGSFVNGSNSTSQFIFSVNRLSVFQRLHGAQVGDCVRLTVGSVEAASSSCYWKWAIFILHDYVAIGGVLTYDFDSHFDLVERLTIKLVEAFFDRQFPPLLCSKIWLYDQLPPVQGYSPYITHFPWLCREWLVKFRDVGGTIKLWRQCYKDLY